MSDAQFWASTPREIKAITDAFFSWEDLTQQRFGTVAATNWNAARATKKRDSWRKWSDFLPPFKKRKRRGLSPEEIMAQAMAMKREFYGPG